MFRRLASSSSFGAITRRSASSYPIAAQSVPECKSSLAGRGRFKPTRGGSISARLDAAKNVRRTCSTYIGVSVPAAQPEKVKLGRGRNKKRRSSTSSPLTPFVPVDQLTPSESLHIALTPSHLPLPIPLGVEQYLSERGSAFNPVPSPSQWSHPTLGPFDILQNDQSVLDADVQAMVKANGTSFDSHRSGLNDHLHVMYALGRPSRSQHLASVFNGEFFDAELHTLTSHLNTAVNEANARNTLDAEKEWNDIMTKLGSPSPKPSSTAAEVKVQGAEASEVENAVNSLNTLLEDIRVTDLAESLDKKRGTHMMTMVDEDGNGEWIRMDSTRRKRKKKINKHKFKKRRKVSFVGFTCGDVTDA